MSIMYQKVLIEETRWENHQRSSSVFPDETDDMVTVDVIKTIKLDMTISEV